jgi:hypothetical protein
MSRKATPSPTLKPMMAFSLRLEREEWAADCETSAKDGEEVVMRRDVASKESEVVVLAVVAVDGFDVLDLRVDEEETEDVRIDVPVAVVELPAVVALPYLT